MLGGFPAFMLLTSGLSPAWAESSGAIVQAGSPRMESSHVENSRAESSRAESSRAENGTGATTHRDDHPTGKPKHDRKEDSPHGIPPRSVLRAPSPRTEEIRVTAHLDQVRGRIAPSLGAVSYGIDQRQIEATPSGENAAFSQILLRLPGVVMDSYGEVHVRGEHGGLTYRVNGVLLPEGLNGFGQELDSRIIQSVNLLTGTLPAQFGFRTAGIVDVTTKSGETLKNNQLSLYGGSYNTFFPALQLGGSKDRWDYFVTASYNRNDIGIENPTDSFRPTHDFTQQEKAFGYLAYRLDDESRLSFLTSASYADFQLPTTTALPILYRASTIAPDDPTIQSRLLQDSQTEQNYYAVLSYQRSTERTNLQISPFFRYGRIGYRNDPDRDLAFSGISQREVNDFTTGGVQFDTSCDIAPHHVLRFGFLAQYTRERLDTDTLAFPVDEEGEQSGIDPLRIVDRGGNWAVEAGLYLQDAYRLTRTLTFNYGLRYDRFASSFHSEGQLSPRANMVWKPRPGTTIHFGYSRFFAPPSPQYISDATLAKFAGTTNAPETMLNTPTRVEKSNYVDAGILQHITKDYQITIDAYGKWARDQGDLGQFGRAVILAPFSYRTGRVYGAEIGNSWRHGGWSVFGNFSFVKTWAKDINSAQYQFEAAELAYIRHHGIQLDHQGEFTSSAGISYSNRIDMAYLDFLYGYGLRSGFANLDKQPAYAIFNIGYAHSFTHVPFGHAIRLRADVVNLFDHRYQIRDGSGVGVTQAQYGRRRGAFFSAVSSF
ncbi:TonB-dependent receptor [Swaminathania salitolerans]|uniref:TonB-dependent receptor-like beta-barrel domain-containing protein n=1 Tax=Swaminathania salitolerans TaxID=182838 RepID=A0A511BLX1_9PROT|nr:TonB-dependent receptor [Swaminathania salitolerans]GBQ09896.1 outer membrane receptor for iron transport [Swaminathania salitolerans LMG 21291]GEL01092.1 hypothetical protein SSA02_02550 [Swaminathania salitolerans]